MAPRNTKNKHVPEPALDQSISRSADDLWRDFTWSAVDEPHATRRRQIMKDHPEVKELFVLEPKTFPIVVGVVLFQFAAAYAVSVYNPSWPVLLLLTYVVSGTANHSLLLAAHELSHNLCFRKGIYNLLLAMFANMPTGIASAVMFQKYHMEHHQFQGVDMWDTDIPSALEVNLVKNIKIKKLLWCVFQPLAYAIRPLFIKPKSVNKWDILNMVMVYTADVVVLYTLGVKSVFYLVFGAFFGTGLHPCAGHFIAEHYEFEKGTETYSYYGCLNYVLWNVGYHMEHHDFPRVPWSKLPELRKIAPEYYNSLPTHESYCRVIYDYIMDDSMGPFARVKRLHPNENKKGQ